MRRSRNHGRWVGFSGALAVSMLAAGLLLVTGPVTADGMTTETAGVYETAPERIDDEEVTLAVDSELFAARGVSADAIDVETHLGVVTLSGTVSNVLAKDRAERIASMVRGVRAVVNQIEVEPAPHSDAAIARDVENALRSDPATESWEISPSVTHGVVTLTGTVDSYREKEMAARVAKSVRGVKGVVSSLDIDYDAYRTDEEMEAEIEAAHMWDARIGDALIEVEVEDGEVTLSGTVGSLYEKSLATADAWVPGVESVDNDGLEVESWAREDRLRRERFADKSDAEIRQAVIDAMLFDPRVASFEPEVTVDNGIVTLTGVVDNLKAKRAAAEDASNVTGVWRVKNYLKVRPVTARADEAVADEIRADLAADPYVERFEIDVAVNDGTARLSGTVDSYFEKWQAGDIAATVAGVVDVDNYLSVEYEPLDYETTFYDWDVIDYDYDLDVEPLTRMSDWQIREDIRGELFWSPFVDADQVNVAVVDGVATLTGTVDSWNERSQATAEALEGGAVIVDNDLEVEWGPDFPFL